MDTSVSTIDIFYSTTPQDSFGLYKSSVSDVFHIGDCFYIVIFFFNYKGICNASLSRISPHDGRPNVTILLLSMYTASSEIQGKLKQLRSISRI